MPMQMFRLTPGREARYRVLPVGGSGRTPLELAVARPRVRDGVLELSLRGPDGGLVDTGCVPREGGFLAVLRELRRQLASARGWREEREFELERLVEAPLRAKESAG